MVTLVVELRIEFKGGKGTNRETDWEVTVGMQ